jgi:hypothetical protein
VTAFGHADEVFEGSREGAKRRAEPACTAVERTTSQLVLLIKTSITVVVLLFTCYLKV